MTDDGRMDVKTITIRTYGQLTPEEQVKAQDIALADLLRDILENGLSFDDARNGNDLQARIGAAWDKADKMQTPWFVSEYILDDKIVKDELESMARCQAWDSLYAAPDVKIFRLPA